MNPQELKTKIKMRHRKKYKEIYRMNCLTGCRNLERIWLMRVLQKSFEGNPEQGSQNPSNSSHEFPMEPRARVEAGPGKHSVLCALSEGPNL